MRVGASIDAVCGELSAVQKGEKISMKFRVPPETKERVRDILLEKITQDKVDALNAMNESLEVNYCHMKNAVDVPAPSWELYLRSKNKISEVA